MTDEDVTPAAELDPVQQLAAANTIGIQELDAAGIDTQALIKSLRLEVLISLLLPEGAPLRSTYEAIFHSNLAEYIERGKQEMARSTLLQGVTTDIPKDALPKGLELKT